jgi:hypothetical protein
MTGRPTKAAVVGLEREEIGAAAVLSRRPVRDGLPLEVDDKDDEGDDNEGVRLGEW